MKQIPQVQRSKLGCIISPYNKKRLWQYERETSIYDAVYHKSIPYTGFKVPYRGQEVFLTYNRPYDEIATHFGDYNIFHLDEGLCSRLTTKIKITGIESFKPAQRQVLEKIEKIRDKDHVWFINMQTGQGKTILAIHLAAEINLKTWIMCFSTNVLKQWVKTYIEKTNIDSSRILMVTGPIIDKILANKIDPSEYDIFICTPGLITGYANRRQDYGKIQDIFDTCGIGTLIFDEAHRNLSNLVKINSVTNIRYQIYLSADFGQGDYHKETQFKNVFRQVPVISPSEDLQKSLKYTKLMVVEFNTYPNTIESEEPFNKYGYSAELYLKYQFKKGILMDAIEYMLSTIYPNKSGYRSLILFTNVEYVEIAYERIKKKFPNQKIGIFHGSISQEEKDDAKDNADIIVATYGSFSTGVDTDDIKFVFSTNQCNKVMDNQSAGRSRALSDGTDAVYLMFVDVGFPYCKKKLRVRLNYLQETKSKNDRSFRYVYHPDMHITDEGRN